jgi:hypothetical protein
LPFFLKEYFFSAFGSNSQGDIQQINISGVVAMYQGEVPLAQQLGEKALKIMLTAELRICQSDQHPPGTDGRAHDEDPLEPAAM